MNMVYELTFGDVEKIILREAEIASQRLKELAKINKYVGIAHRIPNDPQTISDLIEVKDFPVIIGKPIPTHFKSAPFEEACRERYIGLRKDRFLDNLPEDFEGYSVGGRRVGRFSYGISNKDLFRIYSDSIRGRSYHIKEEGGSTKVFDPKFNSIDVPCARGEEFYKSLIKLNCFVVEEMKIKNPWGGEGKNVKIYSSPFKFKNRKGYIQFGNADFLERVLTSEPLPSKQEISGWCSD